MDNSLLITIHLLQQLQIEIGYVQPFTNHNASITSANRNLVATTLANPNTFITATANGDNSLLVTLHLQRQLHI